jgi:hypothetical protein
MVILEWVRRRLRRRRRTNEAPDADAPDADTNYDAVSDGNDGHDLNPRVPVRVTVPVRDIMSNRAVCIQLNSCCIRGQWRQAESILRTCNAQVDDATIIGLLRRSASGPITGQLLYVLYRRKGDIPDEALASGVPSITTLRYLLGTRTVERDVAAEWPKYYRDQYLSRVGPEVRGYMEIPIADDHPYAVTYRRIIAWATTSTAAYR